MVCALSRRPDGATPAALAPGEEADDYDYDDDNDKDSDDDGEGEDDDGGTGDSGGDGAEVRNDVSHKDLVS